MDHAASEQCHRTTIDVYKNLQSHFYTALKNVWGSGKALQKTMEGVTSAAKKHVDSIHILGQAARQSCGDVKEISIAFIQIAESYKQVVKMYEENVCKFKTEFCNPIEFQLLDQNEKIEDTCRKYMKGHNKKAGPYRKARSNLEKHKKKNKHSVKNTKEMQYIRETNEKGAVLNAFRIDGLRECLHMERTNYVQVLNRILNNTRNVEKMFSVGKDTFSRGLVEWTEVATFGNLPPDSIPPLSLNDSQDGSRLMNESTDGHGSTSFTEGLDGEGSLSGRSLTDSGLPSHHARFSPPAHRVARFSPPPSGKSFLRAMHSLAGETGSQLTFEREDEVEVLGDVKDGWQYGRNVRTKQTGWFPPAYMTASKGDNSFNNNNDNGLQRARSVGDLLIDDESPFDRSQDYKFGSTTLQGRGRNFPVNPTQHSHTGSQEAWRGSPPLSSQRHHGAAGGQPDAYTFATLPANFRNKKDKKNPQRGGTSHLPEPPLRTTSHQKQPSTPHKGSLAHQASLELSSATVFTSLGQQYPTGMGSSHPPPPPQAPLPPTPGGMISQLASHPGPPPPPVSGIPHAAAAAAPPPPPPPPPPPLGGNNNNGGGILAGARLKPTVTNDRSAPRF